MVHVSDLTLPEGVVPVTPGNTLVLHVQAPVNADDDDTDEGATPEPAGD